MDTGNFVKFSRSVLVASMIVALAACGGGERKEEHRSKAEAFFQSGDFEKARLEYKNVVLIDPKDLDGHLKLAEVQEKLGNFPTAVGEYKNVLVLDENHIPAKIGLGYLFAMAGVQDAQDYADQVLAAEPDNPDGLVIRGMISARGGKLDAALADASRAVSIDPDNIRAAVLLSNLYLQSDQAKDAEAPMVSLIEKFPTDVTLRNQLARVYWKQSNYEKTVEQLEKAVELQPENYTQYVFLSGLHLQNGNKDGAEGALRNAIKQLPESSKAKLTLIDFLLKERGPEQAETQLNDFIAEEDSSDLQVALAAFYEKTGQPKKAKAVYKKIIEGDYDVPAVLGAKNKLAAYHLQDKESDEGRALLAEVLDENPKDQDALMLRGRLFMVDKDYEKAINDFRAVLKQSPQSVEIRRVLARAQQAAGNLELAQVNLLKAVEIDSEMPELKIELAKISALMGQKVVARDWLNKVLAKDPGNLEASRTMVALQLKAQDKEGAIKTLKKLQEKAPDSAYGHYLEGRLHQAEKDFDSSNASLERALIKQPGAIEPLVSLVTNYLYSKDVDSAKRVLDRALKDNPKHVVALNLKGEIDMAMGNIPQAQAAFDQALKIKPDWWIPYRNIASGHLRQGDANKAISVMEKALEATGQSTLIKTELAVLYSQNGKRAEAIKAYREVLKAQPDNLAATNNLAMVLVDEKASSSDLEEAANMVGALPETQPALLDTKAWVFYRNGEMEKAEALMLKGLQATPNSPDLNYHYALYQENKGNVSEAVKYLTTAVNNGASDFADIAKAKEKLRALSGS